MTPRRRLHQASTLTVLVAALTILAYHAPTLRRVDTHILAHPAGDMIPAHLCMLTWAQGEIQAGRVPLWNPLIFCGYPQWAEGQHSLVGPLGILLAGLPLTAAINLWLITSHLLVGVSALWWLRTLRLAPLTALLGGLSIGLSSAVVFRFSAGHANIVASFPWIFLLAGAWNRWWQRGRAGHLLVATVAWALLLLSSHIQSAYNLLLWWALLSLVSDGLAGRGCLRRWFLGCTVMGTVGSLCALVLILPQFEFAQVSSRQDTDVFHASSYSFPLENVLTLFLPGCFGNGLTSPLTGDPSPYLGRWRFFWEAAVLLNPLVVGSLFLRRSPRLARQRAGILTASVLVGLIALGRQTPVFAFFNDWLPGLDLFRGHSKLIAPVLFGITALGCIRFDAWLRDLSTPGSTKPGNRARAGWTLAAATVLCLLGLAATVWTMNRGSGPLRTVVSWAAALPVHGDALENFPPDPENRTSLLPLSPGVGDRTATFLEALALALGTWAALLGLGFAAWRFPARRRVAAGGLVALSLGITAWHAVPSLTQIDEADVRLPDPVVQAVRDRSDGGRVLWLGPILRNLGMRHGLASVNGYYGLLGARQARLFQAAFGYRGDVSMSDVFVFGRALGPQVRWLGVGSYASADPGERPPVPPSVQPIQFGPHRVWDVSDPTPMAWVTDGGVGVETLDEAAQRLAESARVQSDQILLETNEAVSPAESPRVAAPLNRLLPSEIAVDLSAAPAGWVVVLESLLPGWRAQVDGSPAPIIPAQVAFMAVRVPSDAQKLRLTYRPAAFRLGLFLSLIGATGLLAGAFATTAGRRVRG